MFDVLMYKLDRMKTEEVIITSFIDNGVFSIGEKRNSLVQHSTGKYISQIDDDDDVSDDYIEKVLEGCRTDCDVVGLTGIITFNGKTPKKFIHSIRYKEWYEDKGAYYRCPNHLNPIKASIAKRFPFKEVNHGEDLDYSMRLQKAGVLLTEHFIEEPYYFYKYISNK